MRELPFGRRDQKVLKIVSFMATMALKQFSQNEKIFKSALSALAILISTPSTAKIRTLDLSMEDFLPAPRWEYGEAQIKGLKGHAKVLAQIKSDLINSKFKSCVKRVTVAQSKMLSLKPWLSYMGLKCALHKVQSQHLGYKNLNYWLNLIDKNKEWWLVGGQKDLVKEIYVQAQVEVFSFQSKNRRTLAWTAFDKVMQHKEVLSKDEMAELLKQAGELAFLQQNLVTAYDYLTRSIRLKSNYEVNSRLKGIRDLLVERKLLTPKTLQDKKGVNVNLEATERENEIFEQMKVALAAGDLVPAVEDGIRLINQYPSSLRAQDAQKKLLQIYINISKKKGEKYKPLQKRLFKQMEKVSGRQLNKWARYLFYKSLHREAQKFFAASVSKLAGDKSLAEIYSHWGQSLVFIGDYSSAIEAFQKSTIFGAGTEYSERSMFLLGLTYFQMGKLSEAAAQFERLVASRSNSDYEVRAYYWLWRALQSLDQKRSLEVGKTLFKKYPLTYYGLRARYEIEGSGIEWLKNQSTIDQSLSIQLSDAEYLAWQKAKLLLEAGWFEEAQEELKIFPPVYLTSSKLVMARIWNLAFDHFRSIQLLNEVWELEPSLLNLSTLQLAFPNEFRVYVEKYGRLNNLEKEVVWALIRQESSFRKKAKSSAGALGLMQLMPATAKEVSRRIRIAPLNMPDEVLDPEKNVRMGSSYLAQMLRAFDGHLPLALAAYNVGIGNMRKWTRLRPDLEKQSLAHTSNFRNEIWIDELPWDETSFYVKAVLRNLIIYRMISQQKLNLKEPIW